MVEGTDEIVAEFLVESYENLDRLDQDLIALEEDPTDGETLARIFRTIHTVKGNAGSLGFPTLETVAHSGENLLSKLRDHALQLDDGKMAVLLAAVDAVREMLGAIETTGRDDAGNSYDDLVQRLADLSGGGSAHPTVPAPLDDTVPSAPRVDTRPLGTILLGAGKLTAEQLEIALAEQALGDGRRLGEILVDHGAVTAEAVDEATRRQGKEAKPALAESTIRVDIGVLDQLMNLVGELVLARNSIAEHIGPHTPTPLAIASQHLDHLTGDLQDGVMRARMQPIGSVWSKFPRLVRGLAVACGKQVRLVAEGEGTEVDRTIIEAIKDPLTHIVRNALDHGIEPPAVRIAAGKPPEGTLSMRAHHEGGQVVVEVADDGAGIDAAALKRKAVDNGVITASQAAQMSPAEAIPLIFAPGLSTAAVVTNVSGRGVGMDVVMSSIEAIGGNVDVTSELGRGTTLRLQIPLTLAIVPALIVSCAGERFAIPLRNVVELVGLDARHTSAKIEMYHDVPVFRRLGRLLPIVSLGEALGLHQAGERRTPTMVVVSTGERRFGLAVEEVLATEEIVIKPLGPALRHVHPFSGATIMGDGGVALIIDAAAIGRDAGSLANAPVAGTQTVRHASHRNDDGASDEARMMMVIATVGPGRQVAVPLGDAARLEEIDVSRIERVHGRGVLHHGEEIMPLVWAGAPGPGGQRGAGRRATVIIHRRGGHHVGLVVERVDDVIETHLRPGTARDALVVEGRVIELLDLPHVLAAADELELDVAGGPR